FAYDLGTLMPAQKQDKQPADREKNDRQQVNAVIGNHVLDALGRPGDLVRVKVHRLWQDHYRVNVLIGADVASTTVAHSFFLVTDDAGAIRTATPAITKRY